MFEGPAGDTATEEQWRSIVYPVVRSAYLQFQEQHHQETKPID